MNGLHKDLYILATQAEKFQLIIMSSEARGCYFLSQLHLKEP